MRKTFPALRLKNVIRLCALMLAACFVLNADTASAQAPVFVSATHTGGLDTIRHSFCSGPATSPTSFRIDSLLGVTSASGAGTIVTWRFDVGYGIFGTGTGAGYVSPGTTPCSASVSSAVVPVYPSSGGTTISFTPPSRTPCVQTLRYIVNSGTAYDTVVLVLTFDGIPNPGSITGEFDEVRLGRTIDLNSSVTTGLWASSSATTATVNSTGVVRGTSLGSANIKYIVSNSCGVDSATFSVRVLDTIAPSAVVSGSFLAAIQGRNITITGTGFDPTPANNIVFIGAQMATVTGGGTTSLTVNVPYGATYGAISVLNTVSHLVTNTGLSFTPVYDSSAMIPNTLYNFRQDSLFLPLGRPISATSSPTLNKPYSIEMADVDNDGRTDLIIVGTQTNNVLVYRNIANTDTLRNNYSSTPLYFPVSSNPINCKVADLDNDGKPEIIVASLGTSRVEILRNISTPGNVRFDTSFFVHVGEAPSELAVGDFDKDGKTDIAVVNLGVLRLTPLPVVNIPGSFNILHNRYERGRTSASKLSDSSFIFESIFTYRDSLRETPLSVCAVDLNNDGLLDVAITDHAGRKFTIFKNTTARPGATVRFDTAGRIIVPTFPTSGVYSGGASGGLAAGSSTGRGYDYSRYQTGYPNQIRAMDVNNDGKPELVVAVSDSDLLVDNKYNYLHVYSAPVGSSLSYSLLDTIPTGVAPVCIAIGDLNGDRRSDVVVTNCGDATVSIIKNTTSGGALQHGSTSIKLFRGALGAMSSALAAPVSVAIGDLDSNTVQDIAVVNREGNVISLLKGIPTPDTTSIIGSDTICFGGDDTLTSFHRTGSKAMWATTGRHTSITYAPSGAGDTLVVIHALSAGIDTITDNVVALRDTNKVYKVVRVIPTVTAGVITGRTSLCPGDTLHLSDTVLNGTWMSTNTAFATVDTAGIVTGVASGADTIIYIFSNRCGTDTAKHRVVVNTTVSAGSIAGADTVCAGSTITLSRTPSDTSGRWSSLNTTFATINNRTGVVSALRGGIDTILFTLPSSCGATIDTFRITVYALPLAGAISGADSLCAGATTNYTSTVSGGIWSSPSAALSIVSGTGDATASSVSVPTSAIVLYDVTDSHGCVAITARDTITVNPLPTAGTINGPTPLSVCVGAAITLTNTTASNPGSWSTADITRATVGATTGVVTGVAGGTAVITYTVPGTHGCTPATTTLSVPVATAPTPTITGLSTTPDSICTGTVENFAGTLGGATRGRWSLSNTTLATITTSPTVTAGASVSGTLPGYDTLSLTDTNTCGIGVASKVIKIQASPDTAAIVGLDRLCGGGTPYFFTDSATLNSGPSLSGVAGWTATPVGTLSINLLTGVATTVGRGLATITFTNTNAVCPARFTTKTVIVIDSPNAGHLAAAAASICPGSTDSVYTDITSSGYSGTGYWFSADTTIARVVTVAGDQFSAIYQGLVPGTVTLYNADSTGTCGVDTSSFTLTVLPAIPSPGVITGVDSACNGLAIKLADTVTGGVWSASTGVITPITGTDSVSISGFAIGSHQVFYITSNICGRDTASFNVNVNGVPQLTSALTPNVCDSALFTYVPHADSDAHVSGVLDFAWSRAVVTNVVNAAATGSGTVNEYLDNTTNSTVVVPYVFVTSLHGCSSTATVNVSLKPTPQLVSKLADTVCSGAPFVYNDSESTGSGTTATWSRAKVLNIANNVGAGSHSIHETLVDTTNLRATVVYNYTLNFNGCADSAKVLVTVDPRPVTPSITTHSPGAVCAQTMYQNFGAANVPSVGENYTWTSNGAQVWATGSTRQYCLVNFVNPGNAWVYLESSFSGYTCYAKDSFGVVIGTPVSDKPEVIYFNGDFVCLSNIEDTYQWGTDDVGTLDSSIFVGETNQNYTNTNPDFTHNYYFVLTKRGDCFQKSYYNTPLAVKNVTGNMGDVSVYPNPATNNVNVSVSNTSGGKFTIEVVNMLGQQMGTQDLVGNKTTISVADYAAGIYFVNCYRDGVKFSTAKFVKN